MKILLFSILLVLVNGQDEAAPADIGVVDCDALAIVMDGLISMNEDAMEKAADAEEKAEEAREKSEMAKPKMRQEEDPKKIQEMINQFLDSLPPITKANIKAIVKQLGLEPLFKLAQTGDLTDYDLKKAIYDATKAAGFKPEDVLEGVFEKCPELFFDDHDDDYGDMDDDDMDQDYDDMDGDYGGIDKWWQTMFPGGQKI